MTNKSCPFTSQVEQTLNICCNGINFCSRKAGCGNPRLSKINSSKAATMSSFYYKIGGVVSVVKKIYSKIGTSNVSGAKVE
jgi:hypothetical protein